MPPHPEDRSVLTRPAAPPDHLLRYGSAAEQVADVRIAPGAPDGRPIVVLVHGGFWRPAYDRAHLGPMAEALARVGWSTVAPEYRRVPGRPDLAVDDVRAALWHVAGRAELTRGRRALLAGHSAGGHLVLQVAATACGAETPAGVLALAPVADLRLGQALGLGGDAVRAFLGEDADARPDLDPARLPAPAAPVRIVHGAADDVVPPSLSRSYAHAHGASGLVLVPSGHFSLIDPCGDAWPAVLEALDLLAAGG
ncbi:alpha/beta hydrolase [Blastococcus sp. MG754426]|uniref:alpha/beta hydrolase n=1 Tax=unclassified Blastococcus TaxID=2619396 RepID=UPI001EEFC070|nr:MULTISPECIES: alpha/beta hydrolase [unclassified Blastococcus]MCF6509573.1 alpha/beta hydrolase [Blastococcus sp. MG754426]MCF6514233.1 alpha/beta hydrolase [Blastococcus sp. MG754427]